MNRLYLRIFLGVLIAIALSLSLPGLIFPRIPEHRGGDFRPESFVSQVESIRAPLDQILSENLNDQLDSLSRITHLQITAINLGDPAISSGFSKNDPNITIVGDREFGNPPQAYVYLKKLNKFIIIKPIFERQKPDNESVVVLISLTLVIVGLVGFFTIAPTIKNLRLLEMAAADFGKGKLDSRVMVKSRDAVGSVAKQFNLMAEKTQNLIVQERQLLQAVSHELKTPIARVRFILEKISNTKTKDELAVDVHELDREISEMDILVNELLGFNRISEIKSLDKQLFIVEDVIEEIFGRLKELNPNISKQLLYVAKLEYEVMANRQLFKRALQNLLFNAMRFAESRIIVKCYPESDVTVVEVCDDGPGIPPVEQERIFKPFARIEDSRARESGGVGLGLAIVARIIEKHGGSVTVGDSDIGGARFITKWPLLTTAKADMNNAFRTIK